MKKFFALIIILPLLILSSCKTNIDEDTYYDKQNVTIDNIAVEFYGTGYGTYGQTLSSHCQGTVDSIFDSSQDLVIQTSAADNKSTSANEIYLTLTINGKCSNLVTKFDTSDSTQISSFKISYFYNETSETTGETSEVEKSLASSYTAEKNYQIDKEITKIRLYVRQNKYYSSSFKDEEKRNKKTENTFTITLFKPE